jgi:hypothetical protein
MSRNRRRYDDAIRVTSLVTWLVAAFFLGVVGVRYVYLTTQIHATGEKIHKLELELKNLDDQGDAARARITELTSHAALQRKLKEGFIKMTRITDDRIVHINAKSPPGAQDEIRAVSNQGTIK